MTHQSTHSHDVRAKDRERAEIQRQLAEFVRQGGIPQLLPTQPEKAK